MEEAEMNESMAKSLIRAICSTAVGEKLRYWVREAIDGAIYAASGEFDPLLDLEELAAICGVAPAMMKSRLAADPGLRQLEQTEYSPSQWRRSDVLALVNLRASMQLLTWEKGKRRKGATASTKKTRAVKKAPSAEAAAFATKKTKTGAGKKTAPKKTTAKPSAAPKEAAAE